MNALEFTDCPHCGKRVRTTAIVCHRCGRPLGASTKTKSREAGGSDASSMKDDKEPLDTESQTAAFGGYNAEDDEFQYDEYIENEFGSPKRKRWFTRYVTWILVFAMTLPILIWLVELFLL
jgi:hypothetical protein